MAGDEEEMPSGEGECMGGSPYPPTTTSSLFSVSFS